MRARLGVSGVVVVKCLGLVGCLVGGLVLGACREPQMEDFAPERLPSISATATWVGWVDGGAWIECSFDPEQKANWCTVWDDQVGTVVTRTYFVLRETGRGLPESELSYAFFSGHHIELTDGRVLEPLKSHGRDIDPWEPPPIDPIPSAPQ